VTSGGKIFKDLPETQTAGDSISLELSLSEHG